jgi:hypothetical protein
MLRGFHLVLLERGFHHALLSSIPVRAGKTPKIPLGVVQHVLTQASMRASLQSFSIPRADDHLAEVLAGLQPRRDRLAG